MTSNYFSNSIGLNINSSRGDKVKVALFAYSGCKVAERVFDACGSGDCSLAGLDNLSAGIYILRADNGSDVCSFKVLKK